MALFRPDEYKHSNEDNFAIADTNNIRGLQIVNNVAERDAIASDKRKVGGEVVVVSEQTTYKFFGANTANSTWTNTANWKSVGGSSITYVATYAELQAALIRDTDSPIYIILTADITASSNAVFISARNVFIDGLYTLTIPASGGVAGFGSFSAGTFILDIRSRLNITGTFTSFSNAYGLGTVTLKVRYMTASVSSTVTADGANADVNINTLGNINMIQGTANSLTISDFYEISNNVSVEIFSTTKEFDLSKAKVQSMPITGNTVITATNEVLGGEYLLYLNVDSTGGYNITVNIGTPIEFLGVTPDDVYKIRILVDPEGNIYSISF